MRDNTLEKALENKMKIAIKWQYLSLNGCDNITKDGVREILACKYLTDLKKIDLMHCKHPKFDIPSKSLKISPQIINLAHSPSVTGAQIHKFITRNSIVAQSLCNISISISSFDGKVKEGLLKLLSPLTLVLQLASSC